MNQIQNLVCFAAMLASVSVVAKTPDEMAFATLPIPVRERVLELFGNEPPAISRENFNPGDVTRPGKSSRMVVFAAKQGALYLVHYVHGGRGKHSHVVGIHHEGGEAAPVLNVIVDECQSIAKLQEALSKFAFSTAFEY